MDEIAQYWLVLKRRWIPATLVFVITTALAAAYTYQQPNIFQAKGQIILKKTNKTSALLSGANMPGGIGDLEGLTGSSPVTTQVEILKSMTTINGVIKGLLATEYAGKSPENTRLNKFKAQPELFVTQLKVASIKGTDILEILFQDLSPKLAHDVVEEVMKVYTKDDQVNQRKEAEAAREFVKRELPKIEKEVQIAESEVRAFKENNLVVDLPTESIKSVEMMTNLNKEINSANAQLAAETARIDGMKTLFGGKDAQTTIKSGIISESPGVQKSLKEYQEIEAKLIVERTKFQETAPSIIDLEAKRQALGAILKGRVNGGLLAEKDPQRKVVELQPSGIQGGLISDFAKSEAQKTSLQKQISSLLVVQEAYRTRMAKIPALEQQQNSLGRKLEMARTNYKTLLSKLQEIEIAENQTLGNSRVQTHADVPTDPIAPKKGQNIAIGGFLGLFLGAATAFALDSADKRVKTGDEARQLLPNNPVLGQIPLFLRTAQMPRLGKGSREPGQLVVNGPPSAESEAFRMLQTNLQFVNVDNSVRTIVITSSQSGEGKSTVCANLALAVAELGKRVLLVDADMRKPTQQKIWREGNYEGLSNVLSGQCDDQTVIREVVSNVFLLTAGVVPPNPIVLIDSDQMAKSIRKWSKDYDLVILDAPPVTVAADAIRLGTQAGNLLFVVRPGIADKESIEYSQDILTQSKINILGLVLNGVEIDSQKRYNSYYYDAKVARSDEGNVGSKLLSGIGKK